MQQTSEAVMSDATMSIGGGVALTRAGLGWKFIRWGLGLFFVGFLTGFIPILHYMHGALAGDVGPVFLKNMTLWWGCPAVLAELTLKTGGLGMTAIGFCHLALARDAGDTQVSSREQQAATLCSFGLIAELVSAGAGYAIGVYFWPNFFFEPVQTGKNVWLALQGISIAVFVVGLWFSFSAIRKLSAQFQ